MRQYVDRDSPVTRSLDAEKTPGRQGGSQLRAGAPGLEVSLRELTQRCFLGSSELSVGGGVEASCDEEHSELVVGGVAVAFGDLSA